VITASEVAPTAAHQCGPFLHRQAPLAQQGNPRLQPFAIG
jgi:hypothetical protein